MSATLRVLPAPASTATDAALWWAIAETVDDEAFHRQWFQQLAGSLRDVKRALLLLQAEGQPGSYVPAATWPEPGLDLRALSGVIQQALTQNKPVLEVAPAQVAPLVAQVPGASPAVAMRMAVPMPWRGRHLAVVAFELMSSAEAHAVAQQVGHACSSATIWLVARQQELAVQAGARQVAQVSAVLDVLATALEQDRWPAGSVAIANELVLRLGCDRVSLGRVHDDQIQVQALSHNASFDKRSDLVRALTQAMEEVLDLGEPVSLPRTGDQVLNGLAHEQAAATLGAQVMLSLPLKQGAVVCGVLCLERHQATPFTPQERRMAQALAAALGPVWALHENAALTWQQRLRRRLGESAESLAGARRPGLKLAAGLLAVCLAILVFWPADHRVSARMVVEGSVQLARVAPFDGYVLEASARAGDRVIAGQPMARMDDKDLRLERARWSAEREQAQRKMQLAMSQADRGAMGVFAAQSQQAEAQLALVEEKLARSVITAPFDGVVVSGDLSQTIGTPVERGKTLFEVAPLTGYRVVLQVDDRDINFVAVGQTGELVLSSLPDQRFPFTLSNVTPVATQQDGRNVFRVEAQVQGDVGRLRPGMEGVGKVAIGERSLLWTWTHGLTDWLRVAFWSWLP